MYPLSPSSRSLYYQSLVVEGPLDSLRVLWDYRANPCLALLLKHLKAGHESGYQALQGVWQPFLPSFLVGQAFPAVCVAPIPSSSRLSLLLAHVVTGSLANSWLCVALQKRLREKVYHQVTAEARFRLAARSLYFSGAERNISHTILVDDVISSGATLERCAGLLRYVGVKRIDAVVLAGTTELLRSSPGMNTKILGYRIWAKNEAGQTIEITREPRAMAGSIEESLLLTREDVDKLMQELDDDPSLSVIEREVVYQGHGVKIHAVVQHGEPDYQFFCGSFVAQGVVVDL